MAETPIVAVDTDTDKELELDLSPDGTEDIETLREKLTKAENAKKQIHARAKRAEAEAKELKDKYAKPADTTSNTSPQANFDEVVDLRLDGYHKEDIDFILKNGGRKALEDKNSLVSIAIGAKTEQRNAEANAHKLNDTSGQSEIERKYTPDQLKAMSAKELAKILPHTNS